ncbi:MAG TPA: hypothetical protein VKY74_11445 [Chloroflexia bacterium]|nr:hypothetical protein [Chloroflexia bacterium]
MVLPPPTPLPFIEQLTLTLRKAGLLDSGIEVDTAGEQQAFVYDTQNPPYSEEERATLAAIGQQLLLLTSWPVQIFDNECCRVLWVAHDPTAL